MFCSIEKDFNPSKINNFTAIIVAELCKILLFIVTVKQINLITIGVERANFEVIYLLCFKVKA